MAEKNNFNETVEALFKGMDSFLTTKTIVGEAIHIGDTIILPLADVSFGLAAGAFAQEEEEVKTASKQATKNNGGGGMGGKVTPSAVLVIQNGTTRLVNVKNQDSITKLLDLVPDVLDRFPSGKKSRRKEEEEAASFTVVEEEELETEE